MSSPDRTLFVSPTFTNVSPNYSNIDNALIQAATLIPTASSNVDIIVYKGVYSQNLTPIPYVNIIGSGSDTVEITGTFITNSSLLYDVTIRNISFTTPGVPVLLQSTNSASIFNMIECKFCDLTIGNPTTSNSVICNLRNCKFIENTPTNNFIGAGFINAYDTNFDCNIIVSYIFFMYNCEIHGINNTITFSYITGMGLTLFSKDSIIDCKIQLNITGSGYNAEFNNTIIGQKIENFGNNLILNFCKVNGNIINSGNSSINMKNSNVSGGLFTRDTSVANIDNSTISSDSENGRDCIMNANNTNFVYSLFVQNKVTLTSCKVNFIQVLDSSILTLTNSNVQDLTNEGVSNIYQSTINSLQNAPDSTITLNACTIIDSTTNAYILSAYETNFKSLYNFPNALMMKLDNCKISDVADFSNELIANGTTFQIFTNQVDSKIIFNNCVIGEALINIGSITANGTQFRDIINDDKLFMNNCTSTLVDNRSIVIITGSDINTLVSSFGSDSTLKNCTLSGDVYSSGNVKIYNSIMDNLLNSSTGIIIVQNCVVHNILNNDNQATISGTKCNSLKNTSGAILKLDNSTIADYIDNKNVADINNSTINKITNSGTMTFFTSTTNDVTNSNILDARTSRVASIAPSTSGTFDITIRSFKITTPTINFTFPNVYPNKDFSVSVTNSLTGTSYPVTAISPTAVSWLTSAAVLVTITRSDV